jgi:hypothetical protein
MPTVATSSDWLPTHGMATAVPGTIAQGGAISAVGSRHASKKCAVRAHAQLDERITRLSEALKLLIRAANAAIRLERLGGPRFALPRSHKEAVMRYVALVGRILFSAIFIIAGFGHFAQAEIVYAA